MKRIALCLSGHLRSEPHTWQSWYDNILSQYDVDVFIHTWNNKGNRIFPMDENVDFVGNFYGVSLEDNDIPMHEIISRWNPVRLKIDLMTEVLSEWIPVSLLWAEHRRTILASELPDKNRLRHTRPLANISMYYSRYMAQLLRIEYGSSYDYVISSRFDLQVNEKLSDDWFDTSSSTLKFVDKSYPEESKELTDVFVMGTPSSMCVHTHIFSQLLDKYEHAKKENTLVRMLNPHALYYDNLCEQNITWNAVPLNHSIIR